MASSLGSLPSVFPDEEADALLASDEDLDAPQLLPPLQPQGGGQSSHSVAITEPTAEDRVGQPTGRSAMSRRTGTDRGRSEQQELKTLATERVRLLRKWETDRRAVASLEVKIAVAQEHMREREKQLGSYSGLFLLRKNATSQTLGRAHAAQANREMLNKHLHHLDVLISGTRNKCNSASSKNEGIKRQIDEIRRERLVFQQLFKKMEAELESSVKETQSLTEQIERTYRERDTAQHEMGDVMSDMELAASDMKTEWDILNQVIEAADQAVERMRSGPSQQDHLGEMSLEEEQELKRQMKKGLWVLSKDKAALRTVRMKLVEYEDAWKQISTATGCHTIDALIEEFKLFEEKKYSKVTNSTQLVTEVEALEIAVKSMHGELRLLQEQEEERIGHKHRAAHDLEHSVVATEQASKDMEVDTGRIVDTLKSMIEPVQRLFQRLGCDAMFANEASVPVMFRNPSLQSIIRAGVTVNTLPQFMGVIEQRATELIQRHALMKASKQGDAQRAKDLLASSMGPREPSGKLRQHILASVLRISTLDDEREDDPEDKDRPLTRDELLLRAANSMNKSSVAAAKTASVLAAQVLIGNKTPSPTKGLAMSAR